MRLVHNDSEITAAVGSEVVGMRRVQFRIVRWTEPNTDEPKGLVYVTPSNGDGIERTIHPEYIGLKFLQNTI